MYEYVLTTSLVTANSACIRAQLVQSVVYTGVPLKVQCNILYVYWKIENFNIYYYKHW